MATGVAVQTPGALASERENVLDVRRIRQHFPIFRQNGHGRHLVYLDNAATTHKPASVIEAMNRYYSEINANVHRGAYRLSEASTQAYEEAREVVRAFLNAESVRSIVFTRNATEAINLVAYAWALSRVRPGQQIVISEMEHHSNLVPWQMVAHKTGAKLTYAPITDRGELNLERLDELLRKPSALVAITHASNVLGTVNPVREIVEMARRAGAAVLVDAAQSIPHMRVDVRSLDPDFLAFSGHKMLGPMGIGVLYAKEERLREAEPFLFGGDMILSVDWQESTWNELPWKFEAGTPNVAGAVGLAEAIRYLGRVGVDRIAAHEGRLVRYAMERLLEIEGLRVFGPDADRRVGVVSFELEGIHPHDLATFLDSRDIAIRAGHHCAQPLMKRLGVVATARASFYLYNNFEDVDELVEALREARRFFLK